MNGAGQFQSHQYQGNYPNYSRDDNWNNPPPDSLQHNTEQNNFFQHDNRQYQGNSQSQQDYLAPYHNPHPGHSQYRGNPYTQQEYVGQQMQSNRPPPQEDNGGYRNDHQQNYYPGPISPMESPAPTPVPNRSGNS
ncbi:unnamed protein product [Allacma fusca]|uniref:Uncharacterized protein n=1 Tax=Allacma fusca TaxID=39272 RepID=A0A8J2KCC2_9HEXA|nr:unnamed protein product [Allacma fusca]